MKRRQFLKAAGARACRFGALAAPAIAQSMPEIKWRLTSSFPKSLDTLWGAAETFAKYVVGGDRRQIPDPDLRGRRDRAGAAGARRGAATAPSRCATPRPTTTSARTRPGRCSARCRSASTRASRTPGSTTAAAEADGRVLQEVQHLQPARRQHRRADGRLVPQGDQGGRRPERPEVAHRRLRRPGDGRSSAWCRSRSPAATSIRRWRRAPSTRPNGSAPTTTRSSASTRSRKFYYYPGWWEGGTAQHFMINIAKWDELPKNYKAIVDAAAGPANIEETGRYDAPQSAGAEAAGRGRHAAAAVPASR